MTRTKKNETQNLPTLKLPRNGSPARAGLAVVLAGKALASSAFKTEREAGEGAIPGEGFGETSFAIDLILSGTVKRGPDTTSTYQASVPWERLALVALSKVSASTRAALVREALDPIEGALSDGRAAIKADAETIVRSLIEATRQPRAGTLKVDIRTRGVSIARS